MRAGPGMAGLALSNFSNWLSIVGGKGRAENYPVQTLGGVEHLLIGLAPGLKQII